MADNGEHLRWSDNKLIEMFGAIKAIEVNVKNINTKIDNMQTICDAHSKAIEDYKKNKNMTIGGMVVVGFIWTAITTAISYYYSSVKGGN